MAILGDLDHVRQMLRASSDVDLGSDADDRLERLQAVITTMIEQRTGRVFGEVAEDTTHTVWAMDSNVLILPVPARTITSVTTSTTYDGSAYTGGVVMDTDEYEPWTVDENGLIWAIRLLSGGWWGGTDWSNRSVVPVIVEGDFTDSDDDNLIPADIQYVADVLISRTYQRENASPNGFVGFDGQVQMPNDPWKDAIVVETLNRYGLRSKALVF